MAQRLTGTLFLVEKSTGTIIWVKIFLGQNVVRKKTGTQFFLESDSNNMRGNWKGYFGQLESHWDHFFKKNSTGTGEKLHWDLSVHLNVTGTKCFYIFFNGTAKNCPNFHWDSECDICDRSCETGCLKFILYIFLGIWNCFCLLVLSPQLLTFKVSWVIVAY